VNDVWTAVLIIYIFFIFFPKQKFTSIDSAVDVLQKKTAEAFSPATSKNMAKAIIPENTVFFK